STRPDLVQAQATISKIAPELMSGPNTKAEDVKKAFTQVRQGVDAGLAPPDQVYLFYNSILERIFLATREVADSLPDPDAVAGGNVAVELADAVEALSRGNALAVGVVGRMTPQQLREYSRLVGSYHSRITSTLPALDGQLRVRARAVVGSDAWKTLSTMENAIVDRGVPTPTSPALPVSVADWQSAAATVGRDLLALYQDQYAGVIHDAIDTATNTARWWLIAAGAMSVVALLVGLLTLRISGRLIRRLKRLRAEALSLADEQLPRIMNRLRDGEDVDVRTAVKPLDFGTDEIGDVAEAFNRAESAAVSAAVEEARTRGGINALFLNIAHRSQVVVHRQLELLDRAEHSEEDPNRLSVLFELDHLSTRARRNAENLIILGGEQPGRQWRNPVPLVDLLRSAISETEDYARVHNGHMATVSVVGSVVADLIHLVAELVENATSFSPPESRVDVTSNVVGRGVVVEITDQGLGMSGEQIAQANEILREPPDFGVTNLSSDSRMGLLVVSRIARRTDVTVKLSESDYGGVRAIVLIPTSLIAEESRPVAYSAVPVGSVAAEANQMSSGVPTRTAAAAVPWPTVDSAEPARPAFPARTAARRELSQEHPALRSGRHEAVTPQPPENAAGQGIQPTAGRPGLPRRRRQSHLAPQLSASQTQQQAPRSQAGARSPEQARSLFDEIESGTRQGRLARPEPGTNYPDGREGSR
ncbi:nitrate- and nitrite sensing domain-containing protein, partial [Actinophytocola sp.]|uniref:sensor histidine kinase n=1 Tax=Actinophytocola sp. TaxID=1872138 RepID=UPI00389A3911